MVDYFIHQPFFSCLVSNREVRKSVNYDEFRTFCKQNLEMKISANALSMVNGITNITQ